MNTTEKEQMKTCPFCGVKLPLMNEKGKHNFCPASLDNGGIVNICMKCKMVGVKMGPNIRGRSSLEMNAGGGKEQSKTCPFCGVKLPLMNEKGKHNFCPASLDNGEIVDICIGCKIKLGMVGQGARSVY